MTDVDVAETVPLVAVRPPTAPCSRRVPLADSETVPPAFVRTSPPERRTGLPPNTGVAGGTVSTLPLASTYFPSLLIKYPSSSMSRPFSSISLPCELVLRINGMTTIAGPWL